MANYSILYPNSHNPLPPTSQCLPNFFGQYKSFSPSLPSIQSFHISVSTSHHPDSAHIDDSGHLLNWGHIANFADSGQCVNSGGVVNFAAAACTWMEMVDNASISSTTPAPSSSPPSNLAMTTALWMEMQGSDTPIVKPTPDMGHSADSGGIANFQAAARTWMEMINTANVAGTTPAPSSPQLSNLALTTELWMKMQAPTPPQANLPTLHPLLILPKSGSIQTAPLMLQ